MITIVGLGKCADDLTLKGKRAINAASVLAIRTKKLHISAKAKQKAVTMDDLFDKAENFSMLNALIADRLIDLDKNNGGVVYLVSGDGFSDGAAVELGKREQNIQIIQGVSDFGAKKPSFSSVVFSAAELISTLPLIDSSIDLTVNELSNAFLASDVKLFLLKHYSPSAAAEFSFKGRITQIQLCDLDRQKTYDHTASVCILGNSRFDKGRYGLADLMRVMQRLTAPDGCEWDKEQTHESIRINMIEEAYEAVDAIDSGDLDAMIEEFGDVMLQSVLQSDIASRSGEFDFFDVVHALTHKLVSRHTHIFGSNKAQNSGEALSFWEEAKAKEKSVNTLEEALATVPSNFAALLKAQKLVKKAKKQVCIIDAESLKKDIDNRIEKNDFGGALFLLAALCEAEGVQPEVELNKKCGEFTKNCLATKNKKSAAELI